MSYRQIFFGIYLNMGSSTQPLVTRGIMCMRSETIPKLPGDSDISSQNKSKMKARRSRSIKLE